MNPIVVVHGGGAGPISKDRKERMHQGIVRAATVGYGILREGGSAVDAVEGAVVALEDDPEFNAGKCAFQLVNNVSQVKLLLQNKYNLRKALGNLMSLGVKLCKKETIFNFSTCVEKSQTLKYLERFILSQI